MDAQFDAIRDASTHDLFHLLASLTAAEPPSLGGGAESDAWHDQQHAKMISEIRVELQRRGELPG